MIFSQKKAFSTFDIIMYLTFLAMMLHYAKPNYDHIALQIQSMQYLHPLRQSQLKIREYLFFHQSLPENLAEKETDQYSISWDGEGFLFTCIETQHELYLKAHLEDRSLSWECEYDRDNETMEYLCHALT